MADLDVTDLVYVACRGGWPQTVTEEDHRVALATLAPIRLRTLARGMSAMSTCDQAQNRSCPATDARRNRFRFKADAAWAPSRLPVTAVSNRAVRMAHSKEKPCALAWGAADGD